MKIEAKDLTGVTTCDECGCLLLEEKVEVIREHGYFRDEEREFCKNCVDKINKGKELLKDE